MYDNNMIMSLKQKKRKFEPRIKLNHNRVTYNALWWSISQFLKVFYVLKEFQEVFTITVCDIYIPVVY